MAKIAPRIMKLVATVKRRSRLIASTRPATAKMIKAQRKKGGSYFNRPFKILKERPTKLKRK